MRRREFIALLGGAAAAWPQAARAQQAPRIRRIGVILPLAADDPESPVRIAGFLQGLSELGWTVGRNIRIDYRWGASTNDRDRIRRYAEELLALAPDVVVAGTGTIVAALQLANRSMPVVAVGFIDPVAGGLVESLARPGGNVTGFTSVEYGISAKLLELLKQIAPDVARVGVIRDPTTGGGGGQYGAIQAVAPAFRVELRPIDVRDAGAIERGVMVFARGPNDGLIVPTSALSNIHRELIVALAARHRLPAVYWGRNFVNSGGLISYGPVIIDQWRQAASYVDRILKGEKPAELPVQAPTKYELVINLKTAKALSLTVPPTLLVAADELIE
jgi:putative ABC transport system substrate-binding protein